MKLKIGKRSLLAVLCAFIGGSLNTPAAEPERTFTNPILPGFHADPSICRAGDDYYMVHSTFEYFPGVPVYHSRDLVNWKLIGHCLTRTSQLNLANARSSAGIFAPTIRHHNGTFYMITTTVSGGGNFFVTATNAAGPWSEPVWIDRAGIDPSLSFEDDKVYYVRQVDGERGYSGQQLLNLQTGKLEGQLKELWRGTGGVWPEGPHLYKVNGKYYLMISEGGTSYDHCLTVARSDSPWGPFEANPKNPILTHRNRPVDPFQAIGHGDLVETPDGWWVVFLGFRPQGGRFHHIGRETFLAPVTWENGWPVVNSNQPIAATMRAPKLKSHPWPTPAAREEFDEALRLDWRYLRNPIEADYSLSDRKGWLRLQGSAIALSNQASPTFIGQPQTAFNCRAAAKLDFNPKQNNEEAGLVVRGDDRNHYEIGVRAQNGKREVFFRKFLNGKTIEPVASAELPEGEVILSVKAQPLSYEFFYQSAGGDEKSLGTALTRDLSSETLTSQGAGFNFTGVFIGLYATGTGQRSSVPADFDWFEYQPQDSR
jgi:xylan 1,4-beta-xylosidase